MQQDRGMTVRVRRGGGAEPVLLLLHGLGATAAVWDGVTALWPGGWVVPDLPGHGRSDPLPRYSFGALAAAVAAALDPGRPVVALGHSLGGVLALALGSGWFGVPVAAAAGLGIKLHWTEEELAGAARLAARPARAFTSRAEAVERALRVAGLSGLAAADSPLAAAAVTQAPDGWRLALDNAAFGVGAPDMPGLLAACRAPALLAAGEHDPMCPAEDLRALQPEAVVLPGLGHNAHVQDPAALEPVLRWLRQAATGA
jgi:pimeloyl-ACP methyl ester carboxylesterase